MTFAGGGRIFSLFLDRTVTARRHENPAESATGIIPGNRGKDGGNWCRRPHGGASRRRHMSPVPLDGVAADPVLRLRNCAARSELRNRVRAESGPGLVSGPALMQLPRGLWLLLYNQDAAQRSGGSTPPKGPACKAGRERDAARRGAGESGKARKTSYLGRRENRVTQLQIESNLRGKRSDPLHGANARPKAGAVPVARCWCEMPKLQACQHPSGERAIGRWRRTGRRGLTR